MKIIVDTREDENKFLAFSAYQDDVRLYRDKLDAGDYTIFGADRPGDDHSIIFERKENCRELITNLATHWDRFQNEMGLLARYKRAQIIVCQPDCFQYLYDNGLTKCSPSFIYSRLSHVYFNFGVSTIFLKDRDAVENYMYRMFRLTAKALREDAEYTQN
jgi:ERCC4-type nuclease